MDTESFFEDSSEPPRNDGEERAPDALDAGMLAAKSRIFRKLAQQLGELGFESSDPEPVFYPELTPDIIVIHDDHSLLFEAQNINALELMAQVCGYDLDSMTLSEQIRVHPCRSPYIIEKLQAAGATVAV